MVREIFLLLFCSFHYICIGQNILIKDLDSDKIVDSIYLADSKIICKLSSLNFVAVESKEIEILNEQSGITSTKSGFEFYNDWMRAGYKNQFRYNLLTQKIELIGISRYELGNAMNDGSGNSSVNLLTNWYIGNWNFYSEKHNELRSIPTIRAKMYLKPINLESFSENAYFDFSEKCSELYEKYKKIEMNK